MDYLSLQSVTQPVAQRDYTRMRQMGIGDLLLENRIIFLDGPIHDAVANLVVMLSYNRVVERSYRRALG